MNTCEQLLTTNPDVLKTLQKNNTYQESLKNTDSINTTIFGIPKNAIDFTTCSFKTCDWLMSEHMGSGNCSKISEHVLNLGDPESVAQSICDGAEPCNTNIKNNLLSLQTSASACCDKVTIKGIYSIYGYLILLLFVFFICIYIAVKVGKIVWNNKKLQKNAF
jgi:hypothetical protein